MISYVKFIICFLLVTFSNMGACDTDDATTASEETTTLNPLDESSNGSGDSPLQRSPSGSVCVDDIHKCPNGHECQMLENGFVCVHPHCAADRCNNNGHCVGAESGSELQCRCDNGFSGVDCSIFTEFNRCLLDPNPCKDGLECKMDGARVVCLSAVDQSGVCSPNICKNGGTCVELLDNIFGCECAAGFEGNLCQQSSQIDVSTDDNGQVDKGLTGFNRCAIPPSPCEEGFECKFENQRVVCDRVKESLCTGKHCSDRGTCVEDQDGYRCVCRPGFEGDDCERTTKTSSTPCYPNPCQGDCDCKESCQHEYGYYCSSRGGFMGKNCTIPVPKVACGQRSISVDIPQALYVEYDKGMRNSYIYISPDSHSRGKSCEAANVGGSFRVQIPLPFNDCDSQKLRSGEVIVIKNRVFINRRISSFSMAIPILDFECRYERQYTLVTSLKPVISQPNVIDDVGKFTPVVNLCKVASCPASCPENLQIRSGAVYTVGEMVHLSATVLPTVGFDGYVTSIDRMELSCSSHAHENELFLIENGCRSQPGLSIASSVNRLACFSFQTPRALQCEQVYIHLSLVMCPTGSLETCFGNDRMKRCGTARERRSLSTVPRRLVTIGPLIFIKGEKGTRKMSLYPEASLSANKIIYRDDAGKGNSTTLPVPDSKHENLLLEFLAIPACLCAILVLTVLLTLGSKQIRFAFVRIPLIRSFAVSRTTGETKQEILKDTIASQSGDLTTEITVKCDQKSCECTGFVHKDCLYQQG